MCLFQLAAGDYSRCRFNKRLKYWFSSIQHLIILSPAAFIKSRRKLVCLVTYIVYTTRCPMVWDCDVSHGGLGQVTVGVDHRVQSQWFCVWLLESFPGTVVAEKWLPGFDDISETRFCRKWKIKIHLTWQFI